MYWLVFDHLWTIEYYKIHFFWGGNYLTVTVSLYKSKYYYWYPQEWEWELLFKRNVPNTDFYKCEMCLRLTNVLENFYIFLRNFKGFFWKKKKKPASLEIMITRRVFKHNFILRGGWAIINWTYISKRSLYGSTKLNIQLFCFIFN